MGSVPGFCPRSGFVDPHGHGQLSGSRAAAEVFGMRRVRLGKGERLLLAGEVAGAVHEVEDLPHNAVAEGTAGGGLRCRA